MFARVSLMLLAALLSAAAAVCTGITCKPAQCRAARPHPAASCPAQTMQLVPGLTYRQLAAGNGSCVHALALDLNVSSLQLAPVAAAPQGGPCQTVLDMATSAGAIAAVNGGFFCYGTPSLCAYAGPSCPSTCTGFSLLELNGSVLSTNCDLAGQTYSRTSLGFPAGKAPVIAPIPPGAGWPEVAAAVGAGPNLVSPGTGNVGVVDVTTEGFGWECRADPRTAFGLTHDGQAVLVAVDAPGLCLPDLASFLIQNFGVVRAMNLDGGGSTTMVVQGKIVNTPSDGSPRAVYDALAVVAVTPVKPATPKQP